MKLFFNLLVIFALISLLLVNTAKADGKLKRPPQFVLISFDGSLSIPMWNATRELAATSNSDFTYYISGVYFVTDANKKLYKGPRRPQGGSSAIGFGGTMDNLKLRVAQVDAAIKEGNAISSHVNGHFGGGKGAEDWSYPEWTQEFEAFHWLLNFVFENNSISNFQAFNKEYWKNILSTQLRGHRAPQLSFNDGLFKTMGDFHYTYDSSKSAPTNYWPEKNQYGTWNMPLGWIPLYGTTKSIISMDYNFYVTQSGGKPDSANAAKYQKQMYMSYLNYFSKNYNGNRAPVNIGHHFSTWNGGAYWKALSEFAKVVCSQKEVICTTFDQYQKYLETLTPEELAAYKKGQFDISDRPLLPDEITHPDGMIFQSFRAPRIEVGPGPNDVIGCTPESHNEDIDVDLL